MTSICIRERKGCILGRIICGLFKDDHFFILAYKIAIRYIYPYKEG